MNCSSKYYNNTELNVIKVLEKTDRSIINFDS